MRGRGTSSGTDCYASRPHWAAEEGVGPRGSPDPVHTAMPTEMLLPDLRGSGVRAASGHCPPCMNPRPRRRAGCSECTGQGRALPSETDGLACPPAEARGQDRGKAGPSRGEEEAKRRGWSVPATGWGQPVTGITAAAAPSPRRPCLRAHCPGTHGTAASEWCLELVLKGCLCCAWGQEFPWESAEPGVTCFPG